MSLRKEQITQFMVDAGRWPTPDEVDCFGAINLAVREILDDFDALAKHEQNKLLLTVGPDAVRRAVESYKPGL